MTRVEIHNALCAMGDTSEAVAATLRAAGVKGVRKHRCQCPVAAYLKRLFPGPEVSADAGRVAVGGLHVAPPFGPVAFMLRFDMGHFADLEADPT